MTGWESEQEPLELELGERPLTIIQITDPHLFKSDEGALLGLNTKDALVAVLDDIKAKDIQADLVLATGDISQDQSKESYESFSELVDSLEIPVCWIPGNHDDVHLMAEVIDGDHISHAKTILAGDWQIILLDSSLSGQVYGRLGREQRAYLEKALQSVGAKNVLAVMHHHPVDIQCQWLDPLGLEDAEEFFQIINANSHVKGILWGHIHQVFDQYLGSIRLLATPSTSVQFKPLSKDFAADTESPGYRVLELQANGMIETQIHRIEHIDFTVDYTVKGY